jgi:hypothetical protein
LRISIKQKSATDGRQACRQVNGERGFADPTLLIEQCNDHNKPLSSCSKYGHPYRMNCGTWQVVVLQ